MGASISKTFNKAMVICQSIDVLIFYNTFWNSMDKIMQHNSYDCDSF